MKQGYFFLLNVKPKKITAFCFLAACLLLVCTKINAQWTPVGGGSVSADGAISNTSLAINPKDGMPYMAFADNQKAARLTVMRYNGSRWDTVGNASFSTGRASNVTLAFNPKDGLPYVAFANRNSDNSADTAIVMKYNGSAWEQVGNVNYIQFIISTLAFAIAADGTPYIVYGSAYERINGALSGGVLSAKKFDGTTWVQAGSPSFSNTQNLTFTIHTHIAISPKGTPYVACQTNQMSAYQGFHLYKFDGTNWTEILVYLPSSDYLRDFDIAFSPADTLYAAYSANNKVALCSVIPTSSTVYFPSSAPVDSGLYNTNRGLNPLFSLAFKPQDRHPYIAYTDSASAGGIAVITHAPGGWAQVGNPGFSTGDAEAINIRFSANGTVYTGYADQGNGRPTVETYDSIITQPLSSTTLCSDNNGFPVAFTITGSFNNDNTFIAQLSDSTGSFANPTAISDSTTGSDTIYPGIVPGTPAGKHYRIRVVATSPAINGSDNGQDITIQQSQTYYRDDDGDGYGNPSPFLPKIQACSQPKGYAPNNLDCNDNDATINPNTLWVKDADSDGYYVDSIRQCTQPDGYVLKSNQVYGDCNDSDAAVHAGITYYIDNDHDGYGSTQTALLCSSTPPPGYATNNTDCNDNDASVWRTGTFYMDNDGDGYTVGNGVALCYGNSAPSGYDTIRSTTDDCNDNDKTVWQTGTFYADNDGDGYTIGGPVSLCYGTTPPAGYTTTKSATDDCNDNDATVWRSATFYVDNDGDGYTIGGPVSLCYGTTTPAGYTTTKSATDDCNDNDKTAWRTGTFYVDKDGDGYTVGGAVSLCYGATTPAGYSATKSATDDCNDNDKTINAASQWVLDADGDKYYVTGSNKTQCTSPGAGYVLLSTTIGSGDCNDKNKNIHPGAYDGYDGIDNDCDGQIDEDYFKLSICDVKMYEGNSGQSNMYFTVSLNWIPCRNITVNYTTQNGTATAGSDYIAKSGTLTFKPGVLFQTIAIPVIGDKIKESNETFKIILSNPYNATFNRSTATGTIVNDDGVKCSSSIAVTLNDALTSPTVALSPVPAASELHVSLSGFTGKTTLQVFDMAGRQLKQLTALSDAKAIQQKITVADMASGTYLLVIIDEAGNRKTEKFVVSK